jgi:Cu-processing system ATP-binding protein
MIELQQVCKNFRKLRALDQVSFKLGTGKSYAMMGPNGSGKTTLIKCILGMVIPDEGEILFDGKSIKHDWRYRECIGYMPQIGRYPDNIRIGQLFEMMRNIRQKDWQIDEELIELFQLNKILDKRMHTLSGGTRQKVSAALAFLFNPPVLILDEPTAGLDPVSVEHLKDKILREKERGKLLIITSHIISDLDELATHLIYLFEGTVRYNDSLEMLKEETGEKRLGRAIANFITNNSFYPVNI